MHHRWFNTAIVVIWLTTMGWLVKEKVLPPLLRGEPPSYRKIVELQRDAPAVGWKIFFAAHREPTPGKLIGWALTETATTVTGLTEIHGRTHLENLSLEQVVPALLRPVTRFVGLPVGKLRLDAGSQLTVDALGRLLRFDSSVRIEPFDKVVTMHGVVEGRLLQATVHGFGNSSCHEIPMPPDALLNDALSPHARLPDLHAGQTWNVPVYSPLGLDKSSLEIIQANVEKMQPIIWNDATEYVWMVVYRKNSGIGSDADHAPQGRVWVRRDGTVLQQQMRMSNSTITFVRLANQEAKGLVKNAGPRWWNIGGKARTEHHDPVR